MRSIQKRFSFVVIFLAIFSTLSSAPSHAALKIPKARTCGYVLTEYNPREFGDSDPAYDFKAKMDASKSVVLEDVPTFDQRSYGCCWITSYLGYAARRECGTVVKNFRPSDAYLAAISLYERAVRAISLRKTIGQGGNTTYAIVLAEKYGVIPENVWKPLLDIQEGKNGDNLVELLNTKIVKFVAAAEAIEKKAGAQAISTPNPQIAALERRALDEINKIFDELIGTVPKTFEYEGKTYTPREFGKLTMPQDLREMEFVIPKDTKSKLSTLLTSQTSSPRAKADPELLSWDIVLGSAESIKTDADWRSVDDAIERSLRSNEAVLFGIGVKKSFIDHTRGLISIDAFTKGNKEVLEEVKTMAGAVESYTDGGHAIMVTGIYRNSKGKTIGYRIQNSWGDKGDHGYYFMDVNYMQTFAPSFFFKKGMFKPASASPV